jgi:hypothetical protein
VYRGVSGKVRKMSTKKSDQGRGAVADRDNKLRTGRRLSIIRGNQRTTHIVLTNILLVVQK